MKKARINLDFDSEYVQIYWHGTGGATICSETHHKSLWQDASIVRDLNIDVVILDIGSNDLDCFGIRLYSPITVANRIIDFAYKILNDSCSQVVISEILPRSNPPDFRELAASCNAVLADRCLRHPNLSFWTHSYRYFNDRFLANYVADDGIHVHLDKGMSKYFRSIRGACLHAGKRLL